MEKKSLRREMKRIILVQLVISQKGEVVVQIEVEEVA